ncbi:hypothetical protein RIR_e29863_A0A2I1FL28_9GLOM [Rhizophagus irregularis DAOM 181602=DAOM 197198]|nr:hypothetical protein RIR_e29863_A0A2I1FL28_9GLOM [Rhizophagus irregularis DAOM 181602=DAOM 197198]
MFKSEGNIMRRFKFQNELKDDADWTRRQHHYHKLRQNRGQRQDPSQRLKYWTIRYEQCWLRNQQNHSNSCQSGL